MTVKQVIEEIEALPPEQQRQVLLRLKEKAAEYSRSAAPAIRYLDREAARPMIKEILTGHADLFRKLAQ